MKAFGLLVTVILVGCTPKDPPALTPDSLDPSLQLPDAGDPVPTAAPTATPAAPVPSAAPAAPAK